MVLNWYFLQTYTLENIKMWNPRKLSLVEMIFLLHSVIFRFTVNFPGHNIYIYIHTFIYMHTPSQTKRLHKKEEEKKRQLLFFSAPCSVQHFNVTGGKRVKKDNSTMDGVFHIPIEGHPGFLVEPPRPSIAHGGGKKPLRWGLSGWWWGFFFFWVEDDTVDASEIGLTTTWGW